MWTQEISAVDLKHVVEKLIPDSIAADIQKVQGIAHLFADLQIDKTSI